MAEKLSVLVSGATGQQGGALARVLLQKGHNVRAFVRRPDSPEAKELERLGAELAVGDFEEPSTFEDAARGMDAAFVVATPFEAGTGSLLRTQQRPKAWSTSSTAPWRMRTRTPESRTSTASERSRSKSRV